MSECPLEMTSDELAEIRQSEAVVIRELEREDGSRFAYPVTWGDADEMADVAERDRASSWLIPVGFKLIAAKVVLVSELLEGE